MGSISGVEAELPPGFRFHPRDEELICDYLMKKVTCCESTLMIEVDLNKSEPWEIPDTACVGGKEWYFYSQRDRKYSIGLRTNRATASGYWKATGKDRPVLRKGTLVGMRKTLVFYQGRAPKGRKTDWVMHEFRLEGPLLTHPKVSSLKEDWVLCRVLYKKREVLIPGKGGSMGSYYYDDMTDTSSLPPLMDSYITFDQITQTTTTQDDDNNYNKNVITNNNTTNNQFEQVPCFSIFSQNQTNNITTNPTFISSSHHSHIMEPNLPNNNMPTFGGLSSDLVTYLNPPLACHDKDVLKAFLNHLTKLETSNTPTSMKGSPASLCETSSESYLYI